MALTGMLAGFELGRAGNNADAAARAKGEAVSAGILADDAERRAELAQKREQRTAEIAQAMASNMESGFEALAERIFEGDAAVEALARTEEALAEAFCINLRIKSDDVGMRAVIRAQMDGIRRVAPNNPILERKVRDRIFGEAVGDCYEANSDGTFMQQTAANAGLQAVIHALDDELRAIAPEHAMCDPDERYIVYWMAYDESYEKLSAAAPHAADMIPVVSNPTFNRESLANSPFYKQRGNENVRTKAKVRRNGPG